MKKFYYITKTNLSSDRANVYNTLKTCESISEIEAFHVTLVTTDRLYSKSKLAEILTDYSIKENFSVHCLSTYGFPLLSSGRHLWARIALAWQNISLLFYVIRKRNDIDLIYFRDPFIFLPIFFAKKILRIPVFFEIHAELKNKMSQSLNNILSRISTGNITITHALENYYRGNNSSISTVFCAAAEPERFDKINLSTKELRQKLSLPSDKFLLGYAGVLDRTGNNDPYGVEEIIHGVSRLPEETIFIGIGKRGNKKNYLEKLSEDLQIPDRIHILERVPKKNVAEYLSACDILLIPPGGGRIGNSPTKIFEYLVSGKPIIAANTAPIREILQHKKNALLIDHKSPQAWADAVKELRDNPLLVTQLIKRAREDAQLYTWRARANQIFIFIKSS